MPSSCSSNSSNLSGNVNIHSIVGSGARLLMSLPLSGFSGGRRSAHVDDDGITAGDAIRYNALPYDEITEPSGGFYVKAKADAPANSEVIGIVETIGEGSGGEVTVVISGQIQYPNEKLYTSFEYPDETGGAAGGNDVYFLSAATAGVLQNLAPSEISQVIKPIYQVSPDSPWTGQVVNYIGYQAAGQMDAYDFLSLPVGTLAVVPQFKNNRNERGIRKGWIPFDTELNLDPGPALNLDTYGHAYSNGLGEISSYTIVRIYTKNSPSSYMKDKTFKIIKNGRVRITGTIIQINAAFKWFEAKISSAHYKDISVYLKPDALVDLSTGFLTISNSGFKYIRYKLPTVSSSTPNNKVVLLLDGREKTYNTTHYVYANKDQSPGNWTSMVGIAVSIPTEITGIDKMTVKEFHIVDDSGSTTYSVDNVAKAMNDIKEQLETLTEKFYGVGSGITLNRISKE